MIYRFRNFRFLTTLAALVCLITISTGVSEAEEKRLALLIGISKYTNIDPLKNTVNDTKLLARTLEALNFEVIFVEDPTLDRLKQKVEEFAFSAETADVALVYYAGHGIEFAGTNYLIPADINAFDRAGIIANSVSLDQILLSVDRARQLRIVILDSCRNDPFLGAGNESANITVADASVRRSGLAEPSPDRGTLVSFAAEAGQVALDGDGSNSPFATALAEHLKTPDLEIGIMFRRVRDSVLKATGNAQEPFTYGSLPGTPYFFSGEGQSINTLTGEARKDALAKLHIDQERHFEQAAKDGDTRAMTILGGMRLNRASKNYDPQKGVELYQQAAAAGDLDAKYELAKILETGTGVAQDIPTAIRFYRELADDDYANAINDLGFLNYLGGGVGIPKDKKRALELFNRAADLRQPEAMFNFAVLIDAGEVKGKNSKDAGGYLYDALRSGSEKVLNQLSDNPKMFSKKTREELQRRLADVSLYAGAIDGDIGPGTKGALRRAYGLGQ